MMGRWITSIVTCLVAGAIAAVLWFNWEGKPAGSRAAARPLDDQPGPRDVASKPAAAQFPAGFREYPIGEEVEKKHIRVAAVWLPGVHLAGTPTSSDVIHLEADVHATEGNANGFARDEFVPYLKIRYRLERLGGSGGEVAEGEFMPMVARDGLHYGANIAAPAPGAYRLTYSISPPSAGGLGRHDDPVTGVQPWWEPFDAVFEWNFEAESNTRGS